MMIVGVHPSRELRTRPRLFGALSQLFPVQFQPLDGLAASRTDALISFDANFDWQHTADRTKCFVIGSPSGLSPARQHVRFGDSPLLDLRLRNRTLADEMITGCEVDPREGDHILASVERRPVWVKRQTTGRIADFVAYGPAELGEGELLKDRIDPGRFLEFLPLVHFLREVCGGPSAWRPPPTRAAFIIDDPNLHWPTYGYVRYAELVAHARESTYHISMAMVPVDAWHAHPGATRLFRQNPDVLSLCSHGNDHRWHELGRIATLQEARAVVAQAARRIAVFSDRTGVAVSPVMVPPHESCSPEAMTAMLELGFEAATVTRPYPWMPFGGGESPHSTPVPGHVLSGWQSAELMPNGFPVMVRRQFTEHDEIVLRSYLDQPIILYGHAADLAEGLDVLGAAAAVVNSLPGARWGALADIARSNFECRRTRDIVEVRPFSRAVQVRVGPEVAEIRIRPPARVSGFCHGMTVTSDSDDHESPAVEDDTILLPKGRSTTMTVSVRWTLRSESTPDAIPRPPLSRRAIARRLLAESRDRVAPFVRKPSRRTVHPPPERR